MIWNHTSGLNSSYYIRIRVWLSKHRRRFCNGNEKNNFFHLNILLIY